LRCPVSVCFLLFAHSFLFRGPAHHNYRRSDVHFQWSWWIPRGLCPWNIFVASSDEESNQRQEGRNWCHSLFCFCGKRYSEQFSDCELNTLFNWLTNSVCFDKNLPYMLFHKHPPKCVSVCTWNRRQETKVSWMFYLHVKRFRVSKAIVLNKNITAIISWRLRSNVARFKQKCYVNKSKRFRSSLSETTESAVLCNGYKNTCLKLNLFKKGKLTWRAEMKIVQFLVILSFSAALFAKITCTFDISGNV